MEAQHWDKSVKHISAPKGCLWGERAAVGGKNHLSHSSGLCAGAGARTGGGQGLTGILGKPTGMDAETRETWRNRAGRQWGYPGEVHTEDRDVSLLPREPPRVPWESWNGFGPVHGHTKHLLERSGAPQWAGQRVPGQGWHQGCRGCPVPQVPGRRCQERCPQSRIPGLRLHSCRRPPPER